MGEDGRRRGARKEVKTRRVSSHSASREGRRLPSSQSSPLSSTLSLVSLSPSVNPLISVKNLAKESSRCFSSGQRLPYSTIRHDRLFPPRHPPHFRLSRHLPKRSSRLVQPSRTVPQPLDVRISVDLHAHRSLAGLALPLRSRGLSRSSDQNQVDRRGRLV